MTHASDHFPIAPIREHSMNLHLSIALVAMVGATPALADPPRHAPAHGYTQHRDDHDDHNRKSYKRDKHYRGNSGAVYGNDYGVTSGRCNRDEIGAVIGGVTGAVIGGRVAQREDRVVGIVVGGVLGAVLGHAVGDQMDARDRACMGQTLELGRAGAPVEWRHDGRRYQFTPRGEAAGGCRHATLRIDGHKPRDVLACPSGRGEWTVRRS
jgi:surface antigen